MSAGRRVPRSRYRPDRWGGPEWLTAAIGVAVAVLGSYVSHYQLVVAYPGVAVLPYLSPLALVVGVLGALPAVTTPVPAPAAVRQGVAV